MKKLLLQISILSLLFSDVSIAQNIYTIAGTGVTGCAGDGGLAVNAQIGSGATAVDAAGNIYASDLNNHRIRKINTSGIITTIAGTGTAGFSGDGGLAINAQLTEPRGLCVDLSGNIYFADCFNNRIRKINAAGMISTIAGTGITGFGGDGGSATNAILYWPFDVQIDPAGNLYISDYKNQRVRKINTSGIISTFAGNGVPGYSGDGALATNAAMQDPRGIAFDAIGNVYIADYLNNRIRKVNTAGIISTFAGTGVAGFSGDGNLATNAQLDHPRGVAFDASGNIYIADAYNNRIRKITPAGIISTIAGTGVAGFSGDGGLAINAQFNFPASLTIDAGDNMYILDASNNRLREICMSSCLANVNSLDENSYKIHIFPNPNCGSFQLIMDNEIQNTKLILLNILGKIGHEQPITQGINNIQTIGLANGIYNYIILKDNEKINGGKLIVD